MVKKNDKISIDYDDDADDYDGFINLIENHTERQKKVFSSEINQMGDIFIEELERKSLKEDELKKELIPYILKKEPHIYDYNNLLSYSYKDVKDIYNEIKTKKANIFVKLFKFIFFT